MKKLIDFLKENNISFEENVDGKKLCSFRVGGNVTVMAKPKNAEQIVALFEFLRENSIKNILLGRGSNVVISDEGYSGVVVLLSEINEIKIEDKKITVGAGVSMLSLATAAQKAGLTGLEFAHGIPGSVGGGVYMNAGAYGGEICQVMTSCTCFDKSSGKVISLKNSECNFAYRHSVFMENKDLIVLSAAFELNGGNAEEIRAKMDELRGKRIASQPLEYPSAGSTFKRPEGHFAGKLIEDAGLKGYTVGGVQVSEKHAGFVINRGGATATDIKDLVKHIQKIVKEKFDISLECEIEFME